MTAMELTPYVAGLLGSGGIAVWVSRQRVLIARWLTWLVAAAVVLGAFAAGPAGVAILAAGLGVVGAIEYARLVGLRPLDTGLLAGAVVAVVAVALLRPSLTLQVAAGEVLALALVPVLSGDARTGSRRAAYGVFGLAWLGTLAGLVLLGPTALAMCLAVALADVAAWGGGRLLGGPPLSPLSPAKRWSGAVVGAATGLAVLAAAGALTPGYAVAVALGAPLGDLLQSMLKRGAGVKDAGGWLPGFGGLLDRIDSLLVALAVAVVLS